MREAGAGVLGNIRFHLTPIAGIVADLFAPGADRQHAGERFHIRHGVRQQGGDAAQFQRGHHQARQALQGGFLFGVQPLRLLIDHAQGTERVALRGNQRLAGVEADIGGLLHQRVVGKAGILARIFDFEQVGFQNGVGAKRLVPRRLRQLHAEARFEPLPVAIDQRHGGHGGAADERRQFGDVIERLLRRGVEDLILSQGFQPRGFIVWHRSRHTKNWNEFLLGATDNLEAKRRRSG